MTTVPLLAQASLEGIASPPALRLFLCCAGSCQRSERSSACGRAEDFHGHNRHGASSPTCFLLSEPLEFRFAPRLKARSAASMAEAAAADAEAAAAVALALGAWTCAEVDLQTSADGREAAAPQNKSRCKVTICMAITAYVHMFRSEWDHYGSSSTQWLYNASSFFSVETCIALSVGQAECPPYILNRPVPSQQHAKPGLKPAVLTGPTRSALTSRRLEA